MITAVRAELHFEGNKMPKIRYSKIQVEGEFESSEDACKAIRTVMEGAGYQPLPEQTRALPPAAASSFAPSIEASKQEVEPPSKPVKVKHGRKAAPAPAAPDGPKKTLAEHIQTALEVGGQMTTDQIFAWLKKESVKTTEGSVYGVTRNMLKTNRIVYDPDSKKYSTVKR